MRPFPPNRDSAAENSSDSSLQLGLEEFLDSRLQRGDSLRSDPTRLDGGPRHATPLKLLQPLPAGTTFADRYRILRCLGRGGFSDVYLCIDLQLDRRVAVKRSLISDADTEIALNEAKTVAALDHPSIVHIFDVVRDARFGLLIVMQYMEGLTLRALLKKEKLAVWRCVEIVRCIALAAAHAHQRRIVHRDIKPANILFDAYGNPLLSDFGLAWKQSFGKLTTGICGTLRYMSPEQMRGEVHRIDPRSDIFSLGIVLYEMLTDRLPFDGKSTREIAKATIAHEPTSLRSLNAAVPVELDRACRRAMRKSIKDRYASMLDFATELAAFEGRDFDVRQTASKPRAQMHFPADSRRLDSFSSPSISLVPRGLEPFDRADADGFLPLVAGPRHPNGLPESVIIWKDWLESQQTEECNRLAVLYGPPGSGKTSFLEAGVVPTLTSEICVVHIECRRGDIANRIVRELQAHIGGMAASHESLTELFMRLRIEETIETDYSKIVIVLDQFEEWAQRASDSQFQLLAAALRQCDGARLQAVIVGSDEHWRSITKLAELVEVQLLEGKNSFVMELLSPPQAVRILEAMGRAYGTLPATSPSGDMSDAPSYFHGGLERIVSALGQGMGSRILPVQLAMFAQMASLHHWSPSIIEQTGGLQRLYLNYFEEYFESPSAPKLHRRALNAASQILAALLPAADQSVRDHVLTVREIAKRISRDCGSEQIHTALRLLAHDLKVIVSVEQDSDVLEESSSRDAMAYRMSSDTLAGPIRQWTQQVIKSTAEGRAISQFRELSAMWERRPEPRFFPSLHDYLTTKAAVRALPLPPSQRNFLHAADRFYLRRALYAGCLLSCMCGLVMFGVMQHWRSRQQQTLVVNAKLDALISGEVDDVPQLLDEIEATEHRALVLRLAERWAQAGGKQAMSRCRIALARLQPAQLPAALLDLALVEKELATEVIELARRDPASSLKCVEQCIASRTNPISCARAALLALSLGETQALREIMLYEVDPNLCNVVFGQLTAWRAEPRQFLILLDEPSLDLVHLGLVALGSYPPEQLREMPELAPVLRRLAGHESATIHATAKWVNQRADFPPVDVSPPANADWRISASGLELVRLPLRPPSSVWDTDATQHELIAASHDPGRVWITATALPQWLVALCAEEMQSEGDSSFIDHVDAQPDSFLPALEFDMLDVARLSNWLSRREGLEEVYAFGQTTQANETRHAELPVFTAGVQARPGKSGYRLASSLELRSAHSQFGELQPLQETLREMQLAAGRPFGTDTRVNDRCVTEIFPNRLGLFCNDNKMSAMGADYHGRTFLGTTDLGEYLHIKYLHEELWFGCRIYLVRE